MYRSTLSARTARLVATGATVLVTAFAAACGDDYGDDPVAPPVTLPPSTVVSATGDTAAINAKLTQFRALLGEPRNGGAVAGPAASGRREVNWDGVPATQTNTNTFPSNFFNSNVKLGLVVTTPGQGLRTSDNDFADVDSTYASQLDAFSPIRTFAAIGSNIMDVTFQVAGATTAATTTGFGVVLSDVDVANATTLEFFDKTGKSIGKFAAPVRSDTKGLSFIGAKFESALVARVRITSGTGVLAANARDISNGGTVDIVTTDDFIYGEPAPQ